METIIKIEARTGLSLYLEFSDGTRGVVDLSDKLRGPIFERVRDPDFFRAVTLDEFGAPSWPNGADWAPDALYRELRQRSGPALGGKRD